MCSICDSPNSEIVKCIDLERFDGSPIYRNATILKCMDCGHIYNLLSNVDMRNLRSYYEDEYAPSNLTSKDKIGDRPGSNNSSSIDRYKLLYYFIKHHINEESRILDIGCAMGGFLNFLSERGYKNLYGVEPIKAYVDESNNENIKLGDINLIPFEDNSFDVVILDQVLEHLKNLDLAMSEIRRVLDKGGMCYIGVPDASEYGDELYWYIIREHVQHFSINSLKLLANRNGFELIYHHTGKVKMIGNLDLPNLSVILKPSSKTYCWGIGREFFYLYPNTRLKDLDLVLIDDTPSKQKQTFKGMKIHSSDILKEAEEDSFLIITAGVHKQALIYKAIDLGYKGEIINV